MKIEFLSSIFFQLLWMPVIFFVVIYVFKMLTRISILRKPGTPIRNKLLLALESMQVGHELYVINLTSIWTAFFFLYYQSLLTPERMLCIFIIFLIFLVISIICCIFKGLFLMERPVGKVVFSDISGIFLLIAGNNFLFSLLK